MARAAVTRDTAETSDARLPSLPAILWPLTRGYRLQLLGAAVLAGIAGAAAAAIPLAPKFLIDDVLTSDIAMRDRIIRLGILLAVFLVVRIGLGTLTWHVGYRLFTDARERLIFTLRRRFFDHVNHLCLRFHSQRSSGELFSYLFGSPLSNLQQFLHHGSMSTPTAMFMGLAALVMVFQWDWVTSLAILGIFSVSLRIMVLSRKRIATLHERYQTTETDVSGRVADLLRGSKTVKLLGMEERVTDDFALEAKRMRYFSYWRDIRSHIEVMRDEILRHAGFGLILTLAGWRYLTGHLGLGEVTAVLTTYMSLNWPMGEMFVMARLYGAAEASMRRIQTVFETTSTTPDPVDPEAVEPAPGPGEIVFEHVTFGYEPGRPILKDVDVVVPYGQRVALVGPSGGGKSTLTQLLLRLYDPDRGRITIAGTDIRRCGGSDLRGQFAVVPQDPFIFRTSIRENLLVANPRATEAQLIEACEKAQAWSFIEQMPRKLDERVGEGGSTLSGGQRQRLAIARAMLTSAHYYLFDEATSALDTVSERQVQEATYEAVRGKTAFIIAHRLSTIRNCDRVLVIQDGRIVQDGTYTALADEPGLFQDLLKTQELRE